MNADGQAGTSMAAKYGIPTSLPGTSFSRAQYEGPGRVLPYAQDTRTTTGRKTAWGSQLGTGPSSFIKFGDSSAGTPPPTSFGA